MEYIYIIFIILLVCFILINLYYSSNQNDNNLTETTKLNNDNLTETTKLNNYNVIEELLKNKKNKKNKKNIVYIVDANNIDWLL